MDEDVHRKASASTWRKEQVEFLGGVLAIGEVARHGQRRPGRGAARDDIGHDVIEVGDVVAGAEGVLVHGRTLRR